MQIQEILNTFTPEKEHLIPVLQKVQEELGYISDDSVKEISRYMKIGMSEIFGVLTFYGLFRTKPTGKNVIMVCRGTACHIRGGERLLTAVENKLGIHEGESTPDLKYTLETIACIGCCALAPTMMVGKETHGRMSPQKVTEIFGEKK